MRRQTITLLLVAGALALTGCGVDVNINGGGDGSRATGTYAGTTSQGLPIAFTVTPHGWVESVRYGWRARCDDGRVHVNSIVLPGAEIQNGSFEAGGRLETGGLAHVTGHFEGSQAGGVLSRSRGTAFGVNCRASGITWSADPGEPAPMPLPSSPGGGDSPPSPQAGGPAPSA